MQSLFACDSLTFDLRLYTAYAIAHIADNSCLPLASGLDRGIFSSAFSASVLSVMIRAGR